MCNEGQWEVKLKIKRVRFHKIKKEMSLMSLGHSNVYSMLLKFLYHFIRCEPPCKLIIHSRWTKVTFLHQSWKENDNPLRSIFWKRLRMILHNPEAREQACLSTYYSFFIFSTITKIRNSKTCRRLFLMIFILWKSLEY